MLNNINNFFNLLTSRKIRKTLKPDDLIPVGVKSVDDRSVYQPKGIKFSDLQSQLGGGGIITLNSYQELYNLVVNEQLAPGTWYKFPYRSVNFLNGWETANNNPTPTDPNFNPRQIYTGDVEVLLVQAITESEVSPIGYSEMFPQDIIEYQPYTNKIGVDVDIYNGNTLPDSNTVSGFDLQWDGTNVYFNMPTGYPALFGHYFYLYAEFYDGVDYYYQDGTFEPLTPGICTCQYPYTNDDPDYGYPKTMSRIRVENNGMKVILLDLTQTDYNNYVADTLEVDTVYAIGDAYGWITKRQDTQRLIDVPFDFRARKYRRFEVDLSSVNASLGTGYYGQGDNFLGQGTTGNYKDLYSIDWKGYDSSNITINGRGGADMGFNNGYCDNNVFLGYINQTVMGDYFYNNTIGYNFNNNTIGNSFFSNTISSGFNTNTIDNNFYYNTIGDYFQYNTIGYNFNNNTISNTFYNNTTGAGFYNNTTGADFSNNTIGYNFYNNTIGAGSYYNTIGNYFVFNTIDIGFVFNTIGIGFDVNTTGADFNNNTIGNNFYYNTIGNNFRLNNIKASVGGTDFTSVPATYVYGDYNCEIFKRSDGTLQLSYIDGTNTVQYTAITV